MKKMKTFFSPALIIITMILVIVLLILSLIITLGRTAPEISTVENNPMVVQISGIIPLESNVLASLSSGVIVLPPGDASVFIPAGALDKAGQVVLTSREPDLLSEVGDPGWRRPYVVNIDYKDSNGFTMTDVGIKYPLEICFILDGDLWNKFVAGTPMRVEVYAESSNPPSWSPLQSYSYTNRSQICGKANHLSIFALAVNDVVITEPTQTDTPSLYVPN